MILNLLLVLDLVEKPLIEWCETLGLDYDTIHDRITARNWDVEKAFETPSQRKNSFSSLCKAHHLNAATVYDSTMICHPDCVAFVSCLLL